MPWFPAYSYRYNHPRLDFILRQPSSVPHITITVKTLSYPESSLAYQTFQPHSVTMPTGQKTIVWSTENVVKLFDSILSVHDLKIDYEAVAKEFGIISTSARF